MYDDDRALAASGSRAVLRASNCHTNLDIDVRSAGADELVEITPESIRPRKKVLEPGMRKQ